MLNKALMFSNGVPLGVISIEGWAGGPSGVFQCPKTMDWSKFISSKYNTPISGGITEIYESDGYVYARWASGSAVLENYSGGGQVSVTDEIKFSYPGTTYPQYSTLCYLRNALIALADGTSKPVQDLTYEDELLVWDFDNGCFASAKPLWIKKAQKASYYYRLKFDDGSEIGLVGEGGKCHRLFNVEKQEFISGTDFHVGEHTFNAEGKQVKLMSIEIVEDEVDYYNIVTDYHMNCFANGLLTSTQYNNVYPIEGMKFVKDGRETIPFEAYEGIPKKFYDGMRLGEQDLSKRSVEKTKAYVGRMISVMR